MIDTQKADFTKAGVEETTLSMGSSLNYTSLIFPKCVLKRGWFLSVIAGMDCFRSTLGGNQLFVCMGMSWTFGRSLSSADR